MAERVSATPSRLRPFIAAGAGIATFSLMDALMKRASIADGAYSALLLRNAIGAALSLVLWRLDRGGRPGAAAMRVHALRAGVVAAMSVLFFWGLVRVPMAEGIALSFIAPLIAIFLSALTLGEKVRSRSIGASLLGFSGVGVIVAGQFSLGRPPPQALWGIAAVLVSAVLYAWNLVLQREQAQVAAPTEIAFFQSAFVTAFLALAALWLWQAPDHSSLLDITGAAALAVVSLLLLSWGYARAETQALAPIEYSAFLWACLNGWWMFGEKVGPAMLAGATLIIAGCLLSARGNRMRVVPTTPTPTPLL